VGCSNPSGGPDIPPPVTTVSKVEISGGNEVNKGGGGILLTATVTGNNNPSQTVTWIVSSGDSTGLTFSPISGKETILSVDNTGVAGPIEVKAISKIVHPNVESEKHSITITDNSITSVSISPSSGAIEKSKTLQFTETVVGTGDTSVNWSTSGNSAWASISETGLLSVTETAPTTTITVTAVSKVDNSKSATVSVDIIDIENFLSDYSQLGLPVGTYTAGSLISAMDARATAATTIHPIASNIFYNPSRPGISGPFSHVNWPGGAPTTYGSILSNAPGMRWIVNGDNLVYYGQGTGFGVTITFNVAVIRISDGYGWMYGTQIDTATISPLDNVVKEVYNNVSDVRTISISDLTNGVVSNVTGLGDGITTGYKVYIIVRMTDGKTVAGDFNTSDGTRNVIAVHPEPSY
jgi:hypothetical protein